MAEHLKENLTSEQCIVCYTDTTNRTICCSAAICTECYLEWLKIKRQCMHCKQDQCDFNIWFEQYRVEPEFDPLDILHELTQDTENSTSFSLEDMLNFIRENSDNAQLVEPGEFFAPDEAFTLEYGFMITPQDDAGQPTGPPVRVMQNIDYNGDNPEIYAQLENAWKSYRDLMVSSFSQS